MRAPLSTAGSAAPPAGSDDPSTGAAELPADAEKAAAPIDDVAASDGSSDTDAVDPGEAGSDAAGAAGTTSLSVSLSYWRKTTQAGQAFEALDVAVSVLGVAFYICCSYLGAPRGGPLGSFEPLPDWTAAVEAALSAFFVVVFVFDVAASKHLAAHILQLQTLLDVLSLLPLLTFLPPLLGGNAELLPGLETGLPLWAQLLRLLRVLRFSHVYKLGGCFTSEINHQLFRIGYAVSNLVLISAAATQVFENEPSLWPNYEVDAKHLYGLSYFDVVYMMVITLCTIGFGDLVPVTTPGRLVVMGAVLLELLILPQLTNKLVELLTRRSEWVRSSFTPTPHNQHILVVGSFGGSDSGVGGEGGSSGGSATAFFREYFDEDHGSAASRYAVVLSKGQPPREVQLLLGHPAYSHGLQYLDGSVMAERDLERAAAGHAKAAFVMCNKFAADPDLEDSRTILSALAIKRHVFSAHSRDIPLIVQLIRPENAGLFSATMAAHRHYAASRLLRKLPPLALVASPAIALPARPVESRAVWSLAALFAGARGQRAARIDVDTSLAANSAPDAATRAALLGIRVTRGEGAPLPQEAPNPLPECAEPALQAPAVAAAASASSPQPPAGLSLVGATSDLAVCIEELKLNLLAKSCLCPGLTTLVHNLVASHADEGDSGGAASIDDEATGAWLAEYNAGTEFEVYRVVLSPAFEGTTFLQAAACIYKLFGIVLFGLDIEIVSSSASASSPEAHRHVGVEHGAGGLRFVLNPGGLVMPPAPHFRVFGFVIAEDKDVADVLSTFGLRRDPQRRQHLAAMRSTVRTAEMQLQKQALLHHQLLTSERKLRLSSPPLLPVPLPAPPGSDLPVTPHALHADADGAAVSEALERALRNRSITRHIIVCTGDFASLPSFVAPLRAAHLHRDSHADVVVLHPQPPSHQHWSKLRLVFDRVHYLQGSPFEAADLMRAGVLHARSVVLFSHHARGADAASSDPMLICIYRLARTLNPAVEIVCEIAEPSNIPFLTHTGSVAQAFTCAPFAAGHVFNPTLLDILLVQCYYNNHLLTALTHLLTGGEHEADRKRAWLARATRLGLAPLLVGMSDAHTHLVALPRHWWDAEEVDALPRPTLQRQSRRRPRTYGQLFAHLAASRSAMCLALRRQSSSLSHGEDSTTPPTFVSASAASSFSASASPVDSSAASMFADRNSRNASLPLPNRADGAQAVVAADSSDEGEFDDDVGESGGEGDRVAGPGRAVGNFASQRLLRHLSTRAVSMAASMRRSLSSLRPHAPPSIALPAPVPEQARLCRQAPGLSPKATTAATLASMFEQPPPLVCEASSDARDAAASGDLPAGLVCAPGEDHKRPADDDLENDIRVVNEAELDCDEAAAALGLSTPWRSTPDLVPAPPPLQQQQLLHELPPPPPPPPPPLQPPPVLPPPAQPPHTFSHRAQQLGLPFVYTNPKASTRLRRGDAVFVLCASDPLSWGGGW